MRRKDREIKNKDEIIGILQRGEICRLGFCHDNVPYIVPMNYGYAGGHLYFHSAKAGRKIELLHENNRVCFEVEVDTRVVQKEEACSWEMKYKSVIGLGRIHEVHDTMEKKQGLSVIMNHYLKKDEWSFVDESVDKVVILKLKIDEMTGKQTV
ncbi:MAG: pyridoxamine 5'-phosphate oxidase family protein [Spirochaetales bacterium]|nr:pyridoxamine 5'-phosphate oxidase family protein [Spirochaetales bacterium]